MSRTIAACLFAAGCSGPAGMGTPVDGAPATDGAPLAPGLFVSWSAASPLPGTIATGITIDSVEFRIRDLRAIGDSGNGDTSEDSTTVEWRAGHAPAPIGFPDAPTGLYSKVSFDLDGLIIDHSFEIKGTAVVGGTPKPFVAHDRDRSSVSQQLQLALAPGGRADIVLRVDLAPAFASVDFSKLSEDEGALDLDTTDSQMGEFRAKLRQGFSASGGGD